MFQQLVSKIHKHDKKVGLLCMAYNPQLYYRKIFHALWQIYPHNLKTLMLLYQPDAKTGEFPLPIANDMPYSIIQENVNHQWPEAWMFKLQRAIEIAKARKIDIITIYDEDDEYPPWWIELCVQTIVDNKVDGCWTFYNIDAKRGNVSSFKDPQPYDAPGGAMAVTTEALEGAFAALIHKYPLGKSHKSATGTKDLTLSKILHTAFTIHNIEIDPMNLRGYVRYSMANTKKRKYEDDIDYGFNGLLTNKQYTNEKARIDSAMKKRRPMMVNKSKATRVAKGAQQRLRKGR